MKKKKEWKNNSCTFWSCLSIANLTMFLISGVFALYYLNVHEHLTATLIFTVLAVYFSMQYNSNMQELDEIKHSWYLEQIYKKVKRLKK